MASRALVTVIGLALVSAGCFEEEAEEVPETPEGPVAPPRFTTAAAPRTPPPIAGGTLLMLPDDRTAVASDPDHDAVWIADTVGDTAGRSVALRAGDEPGRLATDGAGRVFVALRRGGAVATIDPATLQVTARRAVCPAPRGLVWDADSDRLLVACEDGDLVTLPAEGPAEGRRKLVGDLRDVARIGGRTLVTTFRSARRIAVRETGLDDLTYLGEPAGSARTAAWHSFPVGNALVTLSQRAAPGVLGIGSQATARGTTGYGSIASPAPPPLLPSVTIQPMDPNEPSYEVGFHDGGFAVDVAVRATDQGYRVALVSPGWAYGQGLPQVREVEVTPARRARSITGTEETRTVAVTGQAVAAAYSRSGWLVVQTRSPGTLVVGGRTIALYRDAVADTGHDVFHATTRSGLACASCHPEGGDDAHTWRFEGIGARRTPSLRGGILGTAPFHWDGDMRDIRHLMGSVFSARMGGGPLAPAHANALGAWMQQLPTVPQPHAAEASVARGEALFRSPAVGCASCHSGPLFTNNTTVNVGTGGAFQVPPLVGLAARAPFMHNGCAETLAQRFSDPICGGGEAHGRTAQLSPEQTSDLVAYLESL
jgi:hypothetical protein